MKKYYVILFLLLFCFRLYPEDVSNKKKAGRYPRESWGLQFGITEDFSVESFRGATMTYINRYEPDKAITIGLSIDSDFDNSTKRFSSSDPQLITGFRGDIEQKFYRLILNPNHNFYYHIKDRVINFYWGAGIIVSYAYDSEERKSWSGDSYTASIEKVGAGGRVLLGLEWFVHNSISINIEYSSDLEYIYEESQSKEIVSATEDFISTSEESESLGFSYNPVKFGATFYFK